MNSIYKLSGKIGKIWLWGTLLGPLLALGLSFLYEFSLTYFSYTILKIIILFIFWFCLMISQVLILEISKCRSVLVFKIYILIFVLLAIYFSWAFYIYYFRFDFFVLNDFLELISNPLAIINAAKPIFYSSPGWYSFLWISELLVVLSTVFFGSFALNEKVFCEECKKWTVDQTFSLKLLYENLEQVKSITESNISKLLELTVAEKKEQNHLLVNFQECASCKNSSTLNVDLVTYTSSNNSVIENKADYSSVICISSSQFEAFKDKATLISKSKEEEEEQKITDALPQEKLDNEIPIEVKDRIQTNPFGTRKETVIDYEDNSSNQTFIESIFFSKTLRNIIIVISIFLLVYFLVL